MFDISFSQCLSRLVGCFFVGWTCLLGCAAQAQSMAVTAPVQPASSGTLGEGYEAQAKWTGVFSFYAYHYHYAETHKPIKLIGFERSFAGQPDTRLWMPTFSGAVGFTNSFGQPSVYAFVGRTYRPWQDKRWFVKVTAGALWGYKDEHKEDIPFNQFGIAPAIIPSIGWNITPKWAAEVNMLGTAGLAFVGSYRFD